MVTRKPVASGAGSNLAPASSPPYPTTPLDTNTPGIFNMQDSTGQHRSAGSAASSEYAWSDEGDDKQNETQAKPGLPESLKVGPPAGYTPHSSQEALKPQGTGTNPFINRQRTGSSTGGQESSTHAWGSLDAPPPPSTAPPPPPIPQGNAPPSEQFENLAIAEPSTNPWQPALDKQTTGANPTIPSIPRQDSGNNAWASASELAVPPKPATLDTSKPLLIDLADPASPESPAWDEDVEPQPIVHEMPANNVAESQQIREDQHAWDESIGHPLQQHPVTITRATPTEENAQGEGWNIVDHEATPFGAQQSGLITGNGQDLTPNSDSEEAPPLPPRTSQEFPLAQPPRPNVDTSMSRNVPTIVSPSAAVRKQKKAETYDIKRITWHDVTAAKNPRVSPILVQNANGPCPLLALVNALTLSTPADVDTALVETLRSREQVSLGLLLDAVFDELMSGRRGDAAHDLPDVSELYAFLLTLHTGMNVNPRFFPPPATKSSSDPRNSMSHVHPSERESALPGTFEDTMEMKLYSTFSIPLIHGWLPERDSRAYTALNRSGKSYEDAQNIMFHEEGLEDKLVNEGLSFEEQATLEDIATIKAFFNSNATQLTPHGLERVTASVAPGSVAILFRNDHFSTLYRHPDTLQLLQLVTDMGYAGHEEVVWESLMDVNGENAEFFSGDFRLVGGNPSTPMANTSQSNDEWTQVTSRRGQNQSSHGPTLNTGSFHDSGPSPISPNTEQEDHDLALALQLQEEEEERHRNELARRRRETELSQQYIEQQGQSQNIPVTQRGGAGSRGQARGQNQSAGRGRGQAPPQEVRPAIPPRRNNTTNRPVDPEAGSDAPPPSYEQAANQAAYNPPLDHPAHPSASPMSGPDNGRRASAYTTNSQSMPGSGMRGRRQTGSVEGQANPKDKDCVVM